MSFLTALFLAYMREEDAFWMLSTVMKHPPLVLREVFSPGMAKVRSKQLMFTFCPLLLPCVG